MVSLQDQAKMFAPSSKKPSKVQSTSPQQRPSISHTARHGEPTKNISQPTSPSWKGSPLQSKEVLATHDQVQRAPDTQSRSHTSHSNPVPSPDQIGASHAPKPGLKRSNAVSVRKPKVSLSSGVITTTQQPFQRLPRPDSVIDNVSDQELASFKFDIQKPVPKTSKEAKISSLTPHVGHLERSGFPIPIIPPNDPLSSHFSTFSDSGSMLRLEFKDRRKAQVISGKLYDGESHAILDPAKVSTSVVRTSPPAAGANSRAESVSRAADNPRNASPATRQLSDA